MNELFDRLHNAIVLFLEESQKTSLLDYLPHILSGVAILSSVAIVYIQYRRNVVLHKQTQMFNTKRETIQEALTFLDTYVSWLDMSSGVVPIRQEITEVDLTVNARTIHNKLCITCDNARIVELFVDIVVPSPKQEQGEPIFEKYNEFRNECRKELGYKSADLPMDRIYLSQVSTRALHNKTKNE